MKRVNATQAETTQGDEGEALRVVLGVLSELMRG